VKDIYLFPFNGNSIEAVDCIDKKKYTIKGFIDDLMDKQGKTPFDIDVFSRDILERDNNYKVLAVPGSPQTYINRKNVIASLDLRTNHFISVIHPKAVISPFAKIGYNVLIMAGVVITSNAVIGNHVCILPNTVIHHDVVIEDYCLIGSNVTIAGNSIIKENCYIGSGTSIINGVTIGSKSLIGLGTNLISDLPVNSKVVGNPARIIGQIK